MSQNSENEEYHIQSILSNLVYFSYDSASLTKAPFTVTAKATKDGVLCEIDFSKKNKFTQYAYYLYDRDDNVLVKQMYIKQSSFLFRLNQSGDYYVRGFVMSQDDENQRREIRSVLSNPIYLNNNQV